MERNPKTPKAIDILLLILASACFFYAFIVGGFVLFAAFLGGFVVVVFCLMTLGLGLFLIDDFVADVGELYATGLQNLIIPLVLEVIFLAIFLARRARRNRQARQAPNIPDNPEF
jgi:hypothetical protein